MVTSRLIDINTAAITYRNKCLIALEKKLYKTCTGCIKTLNSLLPEDEDDVQYRIVFDDNEYKKVINSSDKIECPKCKEEYDYNSVQFQQINLPWAEQIISQEKETTIWFCTKCDKPNRLSESVIIEDVIRKPFYSRFVPNPPINTQGLLSQINFHAEMVEWVWICLENLEDGFTRFRDDNWNKDKNMQFDEAGIDTTIEEFA